MKLSFDGFSLGAMAQELVDAGELIPRAEDFYEDMGGHIIHEDSVPSYFESYFKRLTSGERSDVLARIGEVDP